MTGLVETQEKYWDAYQVWQIVQCKSLQDFACEDQMGPLGREEGRGTTSHHVSASISSKPQASVLSTQSSPVPHHTGLGLLCASLISLLFRTSVDDQSRTPSPLQSQLLQAQPESQPF